MYYIVFLRAMVRFSYKINTGAQLEHCVRCGPKFDSHNLCWNKHPVPNFIEIFSLVLEIKCADRRNLCYKFIFALCVTSTLYKLCC